LPRSLLRRAGLHSRSEEPREFAFYTEDQQVHLFLSNLYFKASDHLVVALKASGTVLATAQRWLDTADGIVLPYLLEADRYDPLVVNELTRFALESCANNYANFISRLKSMKKLIRKSLALGQSLPSMRDMGTYLKWYRKTMPSTSSKYDMGIHCNLWCQGRGTGLADNVMALNSLRKFKETVTQPDPVTAEILDHYAESIRKSTSCVRGIQGLKAKLSSGPKACLQMRQSDGGQTGYLCKVVREKRVKYRFDPETLERTHDPRRIKSSGDVLDYCIDWVLSNPGLSKVVKPHVVLEPSKARLITITPWEVSRIQGVVAHLINPCLKGRYQTKSGMSKDRHLWNLFRQLHPQDTAWGKAKGKPVLSTDMRNATDQHSRRFAKRIWREILWHLKDVKGAPLGLIALGAHLHTSERYVVEATNTGNILIDQMFKTTVGIFMGDFLTKSILTFNQDICMRQAQVQVYSIVGDDIVGLDDEEKLHTYLGCSSELGNGVSVEDTYISKKYMFYCEEMALVPRDTTELPLVQIKRNSSKISYLDTPRLRLMIPTCTETLGFSGVQAGRFSLLGKESRWVSSVHQNLVPLYRRAQLLQHVMLPQERDTQCPFTPEDIGGDGGFIPDGGFLHDVIRTKSRDVDETYHRIGDLYRSRLGMRLVRDETLNQVVTKYKAWLPTEELLRSYLPEDVVISLDEGNSSLRSLNVRGLLETPYSLFLKMVKAAYYRSILRGVPYEDLPKLDLVKSPHALGVRGGKPTYVSAKAFLEHWCNPGFSSRNQSTYLIRSDRVPREDYLCLNWEFGRDKSSLQESLGAFFQYHADTILDLHGESVLEHLVSKIDLPLPVRERLHMFVESDSIIKEEFCRKLPEEDTITLVSRDQRLAADLVRLGRSRGREYQVFVLRPCFYLYGRLYEFDELSSSHIIEDQGAMIFEDVTLFNEGVPPDWIEDPIRKRRSRHDNVWVIERVVKPTIAT